MHPSLPSSRSYNPGGEPGGAQIRSATAAGERQICSYYVCFRGVRHIECVLWTACSEYRLNPKPGTYATSINVILWSLLLWKMTSMLPIYSTFILRRSPIVIVSRPGGGGAHIVHPCPVVRHMTRRAAVSNPNIILIAARLHYKRTVQVTTRYSIIPYHAFTRYVKLAWWRKLRQGGLFAEGARG